MLGQGLPRHTANSYLFIDGESFRHALLDVSEAYFDGQDLQVNWGNLRGNHRKVFYYDAIPVQRSDEDEIAYADRVRPKRAELAAIEREPGYHVKTGDVHRRRTRGNEQKMVDVQLTVDMLQAASRGLIGHCSLITGDLDFRPLIVALVEMGVDVDLHFPPRHTSDELLAAADSTFPIDLRAAKRILVLSDAMAELSPDSYFDFQSNEPPPDDAVAVWEDSRFGRCFVAKGAERYRLVTERCVHMPKTHRLIVTASRLDHLDRFAAESHQITLPK